MRIGLNALYLIPGEVGGTETYARRLVEHLPQVGDHDYVLFSNREAAGSWGVLPERVRLHVCGVDARSRPARILWEQTLLPLEARRAGVGLVHSLGYTAPLVTACPSVVTLHDLNYHFHPEDWSRSGLLANRLLVPAAARRATRVLTISASSARAIEDVLGIPSSRIDVVHHGVDGNVGTATQDERRAMRERLKLSPGYLLSVTATHPHKNLPVLLAAYERLRQSMPDAPPLVLVGVAGRDQHKVEAMAGSASGRVILTGWLDDRALAAIYADAGAFVFASRYEGFGFPVLEAMSLGIPVVSSDATSLPELCGDAALLCDPDDTTGFADAMYRVLVDTELRARLVQDGHAQSEKFTWKRAAEKTIAVYERATRRA